ncbi:DUF6454 family protein [Agriterribacter sp.]|uniref:DUF6454 family protein n=1 Tax=Agriterribacter sp. TaxID=2821509 RepID=UPI002C3A8FF2|nr:DUF6454 family protein [Agriterribacter sp.]HRO48452.1 DUF6454 family protein [Agriterribacter sp.]HRQ18641.1 DUF6454 family protein [Agriterribacter sp.]
MKQPIRYFTCLVFVCIATGAAVSAQHADTGTEAHGTSPIFKKLQPISSNSQWKQISATPLRFTTYHTQGLTKVNGFFYMTAVKVNRWPKPYGKIMNGYDRDNGDGMGYLFRFDSDGKLTDSIQIGEGVIYHPGGIDYDGKYIWVPVCEYRPNGKSLIYRIDPGNMQKTKMAACNDALGAIAYNRDNHTLVGMNWGSRKFYEWKVATVSDSTVLQPVSEQGIKNLHYYIDYQDCNYIGDGLMLCAGLKTYKHPNNGTAFKLGGIEVIDMRNYSSVFQFPVNEWAKPGTVMTNNPCFAEIVSGKLRFYFVPEDDHSTLYTYELEE